MISTRLTAALALTAGLLVTAAPAAQAQEMAPPCRSASSFPEMVRCTKAYAATHPSHDPYMINTHFRGIRGEKYFFVGGIPGDRFEIQYCRQGAWQTASRAAVTADGTFDIAMTFDQMPKNINLMRIQNTSAGVTAFTQDLTSYPGFTGTDKACGGSAPKAAAPKADQGGLAKTGF